jgi:hypothetical protein
MSRFVGFEDMGKHIRPMGRRFESAPVDEFLPRSGCPLHAGDPGLVEDSARIWPTFPELEPAAARGIRGDGAMPPDDFIQARVGHTEANCKHALSYPEGFQALFRQQFSWMCRRVVFWAEVSSPSGEW